MKKVSRGRRERAHLGGRLWSLRGTVADFDAAMDVLAVAATAASPAGTPLERSQTDRTRPNHDESRVELHGGTLWKRLRVSVPFGAAHSRAPARHARALHSA
jgi:hypothetical protein